MRVINNIILALVIIGAVNWGCVGIFGVDIIGTLFGGMTSTLSRILFALVGIAGLWSLTFFGRVSEEHD